MTVALDLSPHLRAARRTLLYLVVGLGQGLTYLLVIGGGLVFGVLLTPLWVGLPILSGTARLTWRLAEGERRQANRLLETHLPPVGRCRGRGVRAQIGNRPFCARPGCSCSSCRSRSRACSSPACRCCWRSRSRGSG